jgi:hypothetical protein
MTGDDIFGRRQFVRGTVIAGTTLSLAGCLQLGDDGDDGGSATDDPGGDSNDGGSTGDDSDSASVVSGEEISIGETVQATLTEDAPNAPYQDRTAVPYDIAVDERRRVRISHESDGFDTYLILSDESGSVVERNAGSLSLADDDQPPGDDSLLMPLLSPGETYTIWAGLDGFVTEPVNFTLSVGGTSALTGDASSIALGETVTTDADAAVADPNNPSQLSYDLKVPLRLELTNEKRVGIEGARWTVVTDDRVAPVTAAEGEPSGNHRIRVDGRNIVQNSRVAPTRPDEGVVTFTGEYGEMTLSPGAYLIWFDVGKTVTVREPIPVAERIEGAAGIAPGETVTGELTTENPRDPRDHAHAVPYTLDGSEGQTIYATLDDTDFLDPWLLLTDTDGTAISSGGSRMPAQLPDNGTYVIWVRSQISNEAAGTLTGGFELSVTAATVPDRARTVSVGETVSGEITEDSPRDPVHNDLAIPFVVEGDGTGIAVLTQESDEFDPRLSVTDGTGQERTPPPGQGRNSANVVEVPFGLHGLYIVWAGSATGYKTGTFSLSVEEGER